MSSPDSTGNQFVTPNSSPEVTEAEVRTLANSFAQLGNSSNETNQYFDDYYSQFIALGETARGRRARLREQQVSPAQVNQQTEAILHSLDRVRNLINFEVDYANVRCTQQYQTSNRRPTQRLNLLVQQRLAYFESKSTTNIASS